MTDRRHREPGDYVARALCVFGVVMLIWLSIMLVAALVILTRQVLAEMIG